jgi:hypothetical protein
MSIDPHPGKKPLVPPPPPNWGEIAPAGETAVVVRFALVDRVVTFPVAEFKRWEHAASEPETLTISTEKEQIVLEGRELAEIRAALDLGRLSEVRVNYPRSSGARPGPRVQRIVIEPA